MTRTEILLAMHAKEPRAIFYPMELGGSAKQLSSMEAEGLIRSQSRYGGRRRQRDWYLDEEQHKALCFLFGESQMLCSRCPSPGSENKRCARCPRAADSSSPRDTQEKV